MNALRSEWIKLSTLNVNKVLLGVAVAFPIVVTALVAAFGDDPLTAVDLADLIAGLGLLSALLFGVIATIGMAGEYNYNTIRPTFAGQPVRIKPLTAKLVVHVLVTLALVVGTVLITWLLGIDLAGGVFSWWSVDGRPNPARAALFGTIVFAIGTVIIGFGLGNLVRNTPAAVTFLILWPLVIENILARVLFNALDLNWEKYLPFTEGLTLGFVDRGDGSDVMTRFNGSVYFFAWAIAITVFGLIRSERTDA